MRNDWGVDAIPGREMSLWCAAAAERATATLECSMVAAVMGDRLATLIEGYAGLLASASSGSAATSAYLLEAAATGLLVSPGEFHVLDEPEGLRRRSLVRSGCLLLAAVRRGRMDLVSEAAVRRVQSYQHQCGGFFDMDPGQGHGLVEAFTTAWAGRVALRMSWHERARQAAQLLAEMFFMQPDPEGRFYFAYDTMSSALVTRWRGREPQARYLDFGGPAGETHHIAMPASFLAEMHLAEPAAGWDRPLAGYVQVMSRWAGALLDLPAMGTVAEALSLSRWALGREGPEVGRLLARSLRAVVGAVEPSGEFPEWECGLGADYPRGFSSLEATGWTALSLLSLAQSLPRP